MTYIKEAEKLLAKEDKDKRVEAIKKMLVEKKRVQEYIKRLDKAIGECNAGKEVRVEPVRQNTLTITNALYSV